MEINISQDIRKFKTKDIGSFSFAEAGFAAGALAVGFVIWKLTESFELLIPPVAIILVIGFFKPYGMNAITFIRTVGKELFMPRVFIYETDFEYDAETIKKLNPECRIPEGWDDVQPSTLPVVNKQDMARLIT